MQVPDGAEDVDDLTTFTLDVAVVLFALLELVETMIELVVDNLVVKLDTAVIVAAFVALELVRETVGVLLPEAAPQTS